MVLGGNVEQDQTRCRIQEWQLYLSYFWHYLPLLYLTLIIHWFCVRSVIFDSDNSLILCPLCKSKTLLNIFIILGRNVEQDQTMCQVQEWLPSLLLALSPFVIFDTDNPLILCPLCKSKTLWNIFIILGRNVEQDQTMCQVQEWLPSLLLALSPFVIFDTDNPLISFRSLSQRPFGIF